MSFVRIYVHTVWATLNREKSLQPEARKIIFDHIKENAVKKEIFIDCINGYTDHVHCLISLGKQQSICDVLQLIKGESSFWINKNKIIPTKFRWEEQFYADAISFSQIDNVRKYIYSQEEHHKKVTWQEECDNFLKDFGLYEQVKSKLG
ncbi:MAG: transposase [Bacteroidia bacterium]|nr:transposase [Bacteroidia bacterium]